MVFVYNDFCMERLEKLVQVVASLGGEGISPEEIYRRLVSGAVDLIPEADYGSLSLLEGESWRFLAAVGHDEAALAKLELPRESCLISREIAVVENLMDRAQNGNRADLDGATRPIRSSMTVSLPVQGDRWMTLAVDIAQNRQADFTEESRRMFSALAALAETYLKMRISSEELERSNSQLRESYEEINRLSQNLRHMLYLTSQLGSQYSPLETFYDDLLSTALMVVEEADYGSISLVDSQVWRFIAVRGHDRDRLLSLRLDPKDCYITETPRVVDLLSVKPVAPVAEASRPIRQSLILSLPVGEAFTISFSMDIDQDNPRGFRPETTRVFQAFGNLASSFLKMRLSSERIRMAYVRFARKLATVAEAHDDDTGQHIRRVGEISAFLAERLGLERDLVEAIRTFAPLHDIGKIFIDRSLLKKPEKLSEEEFAEMRRHTTLCEEFLDDPYFKTARNIAVNHHERYDGKGYPRGLEGEEIPLEAQLVSLADVYDALRSRRSYKEPLSHAEAVRAFHGESEKLDSGRFSPQIQELFLENEKAVSRLYSRLSGTPQVSSQAASPESPAEPAAPGATGDPVGFGGFSMDDLLDLRE